MKKAVYDDNEDDIKYLQEIVDRLSKLKNHYIETNQYHDHNVKYHGIETIKYLFENNDEDYNLYPTNYQQYQSFSSKTLLKLDEYLEKIRPEWIKIIKDCKVSLSVNIVFKSIKNFNDKRNLCIKSDITTDIDEIFSQLIKKYKDLCESLKNIDLILKGIKLITYSFNEIIRMNTFVKSS